MPRALPLTLLAPLVLALLPTAAEAYSVDNHERITREALALLAACDAGRQRAPADTARLLHYNAAQDDLARKARVWHFPPAWWYPARSPAAVRAWAAVHRRYGDDFPRAYFEGLRTATRCPASAVLAPLYCGPARQTDVGAWVGYLVQRARRSGRREVVYAATGALLHYLQDMHVPAHVVPVFHPKGICKDRFDSHPRWRGYADQAEARAACAALRGGGLPVIELFEDAVEQTLGALDADVEVTVDDRKATIPWRFFWGGDRAPAGQRTRGDSPAGRFADYGCEGTDRFGVTEFDCEGSRCAVASARYDALMTNMARAAVRASAVLILRMEAMLDGISDGPPTGRDAPRGDYWVPDPCFHPNGAVLCALPGRTDACDTHAPMPPACRPD